jgi:predicted phosphoribosyltransferase
MEIFRDRVEAGKLLASTLMHFANKPNVIVLGLPRGGVPVAFQVSEALKAPLDVFVVRKLGTPGQPELAMGAIATGGVRVLNEEVIRALDIPTEVIDDVTAEQEQELRRRELAYRGSYSEPEILGKTVILIDDGVATGSTMRAAIRALKAQYPARLIVGVPTAAASTYYKLRSKVDEFVALMTPEPFYGVGKWYLDFSQTTDEKVTELLQRARQRSHTSSSVRTHRRHINEDCGRIGRRASFEAPTLVNMSGSAFHHS